LTLAVTPRIPDGFTISKRSPDGAQHNPGFSYAAQQPRVSPRFTPSYGTNQAKGEPTAVPPWH
jgi:hypothetical protein